MTISLRRVTAGGRYIPEIDGLRFMAIASVVLFHISLQWGGSRTAGGSVTPSPQLSHLLHHFDRGVPVFFCISGLILGLPFARHSLCEGPRVGLGDYLLRRVTRIEPPYLINLLLRFPLFLIALHPTVRAALHRLLASLFYLHGMVYGSRPAIHPPSWSLEIEVQFYLLAPWIAALVFMPRRPWLRRTLLLGAVAAASVLAAHLTPVAYPRLSLTLAAHMAPFLSGMLLADLYLNVFANLPESWLWDVVAVPLWCAIFMVPNHTAVYLVPLSMLLLVPAAFRGKGLRPFFRLSWTSTIGGMCYSLYLTHSLVLQLCFLVLARTRLVAGSTAHLLAGVLLSVPAILSVGTAYFVLVERPCMDRRWPAKLWTRVSNLGSREWWTSFPSADPVLPDCDRPVAYASLVLRGEAVPNPHVGGSGWRSSAGRASDL